jgi:hypothetical protein
MQTIPTLNYGYAQKASIFSESFREKKFFFPKCNKCELKYFVEKIRCRDDRTFKGVTCQWQIVPCVKK